MTARYPLMALVAIVALGAGVYFVRSRNRHARVEQIAAYREVTGGVRASLAGTKSRCNLAAPSPEEQADWKRLQEPRALGHAPMSDLLRRNDADLINEVTDRLWDEFYSTGLGAMSEPERNFHLVNVLSGEVNNGGFHQYFLNSSGDCAARTRGAVQAFDADLARLYERALAKFPNSSPSEDRAERNAEMERVPDEFDAWSTLDNEFYKMDMTPKEARYIRANQAAFDSPLQSAETRFRRAP